MYIIPPTTIPINITGKKITVHSSFIIPQDAFNPNIKNFPTNVKSKVVARKSLSSAVLGSEGLFNLSLHGNGVAALESNVPEDELIEVILENDELKIDGNLAVCWSSNLDFTVERSTKTLVGSAVSGEGLVNVYRGTGRVLMCPVAPTTSLFESTNTMAAKAAAKSSNTFGK